MQVDNKGNPVKQYEPFFSSTSEYEDEVQLVEWGVSPTLHYDPQSRKVRVDHPDGTFEEVRFDGWSQETWDRCDTVLLPGNGWYAARQGSPDPLVQRSVDQSTPHAGTPTTAHLDVLGRVFLTEEKPDAGTTYATRLTRPSPTCTTRSGAACTPPARTRARPGCSPTWRASQCGPGRRVTSRSATPTTRCDDRAGCT